MIDEGSKYYAHFYPVSGGGYCAYCAGTPAENSVLEEANFCRKRPRVDYEDKKDAASTRS